MNFSPQPKKFKYTLNIRGIITQVLENALDGWLTTTIKYTKSAIYGGLQRAYSSPIKFTFLGATLLRREFYQFWFMSLVKIVIQELQDDWTYKSIFNGKIDFSTTEDSLTEFSVTASNDDFSANVDAYDSVQYSIPIDVEQAINLELPPLALKETATLLPQPPPDNMIHADYFPPITLVNSQQNSVNASVQNVQYRQFRNPDFSTDNSWFFNSQYDGKLHISGSLTILSINGIAGDKDIRFDILDQVGGYVYKILEYNPIHSDTQRVDTVNIDIILDVPKGKKLFLYQQIVNPENPTVGMTIIGGQLDLSFETSSPASMCKALPANYVYKQLLQAMNVNTDSGPNLPVPTQSYLMDKLINPNAILKNLYIICSDSIRAAIGTLYKAGDTIFEGTYIVKSGSINYNDVEIGIGVKFNYSGTLNTFTGDGVVQKIQSVSVGNVYNPGDSLQPGGTYIVGGNPGDSITYNNIVYNVGGFFTYVLNQDTFAANGDDGSEYVQQTAEAIQMILSFGDFFQSIKAVMGGDCAFGYDAKIQAWFIEKLGYVYRTGISTADLGNVSDTWKRQPALDLMGNKIKAGYKDQQYDQLSGTQEVNSEQEYTVPILAPTTEINLQSIIRADPYGIEGIRITQANTAASRSDNDNFFVWVKDEPEAEMPIVYYHPLTNETLSTITGVDPSYYNWKLSPKQNLLRGGAYLASIFYGLKGYQITQSFAAKNNGLVTIENGVKVVERDPIIISSLPAPYFIPMYCSFSPGLDSDTISAIDTNPYAEIQVIVNGVKTKVFLSEIAMDIGSNTPQQFKTLLSPNNNLLDYIN